MAAENDSIDIGGEIVSTQWTRTLANVCPEIRKRIRTIAIADPLWGAPRIHRELLKFGFGAHRLPIDAKAT